MYEKMVKDGEIEQMNPRKYIIFQSIILIKINWNLYQIYAHMYQEESNGYIIILTKISFIWFISWKLYQISILYFITSLNSFSTDWTNGLPCNEFFICASNKKYSSFSRVSNPSLE